MSRLNLPEIPNCRKWVGNSTPEQDASLKLLNGIALNAHEIEILDCGYNFLNQLILELKSKNLTALTEDDIPILKEYLNQVFNSSQIFQNVINVGMLHRMVWVKGFNEEDGTIRHPRFLSNTPIDIIKKNGVFGRANSSASTCLYLAESGQTAVFECKPIVGDRIVLTAWRPKKHFEKNGELSTQITCYPIVCIRRTTFYFDCNFE